jgi:Domain of unknown function (DUF4153)
LAKIFSLENLNNVLGSFLNSFRRFPFTLVCSLLATFCFIRLAAADGEPNNEIVKYALTFLIGVPLLFSAEIFEERKRLPQYLVIGLAVAFLLFFYFFDMPKLVEIGENKLFTIKYAALVLIFHLLISVSPYLFQNNVSGFWQYNKTLFITILTAFLYTFTLSAGLVLAISGIQNLFDIKLDNDWYVYIWFGINGFFNTLIFTSKIPKLNEMDIDTSFPIGLKYFTQYVLLPLVAIYLGILIAYEAKIVIAWSLPKGWVSLMVLASAIFGILAFLLIFPLKEANKWIQSYTKIYYWILLPLVGLMMVAVYVRIKQYGLTEPRYFVALLAVWLLGISLYFSISKVDNIKMIPLSLLLVGLFGIYAPFNAFHSSRINQLGRMEAVLEKNNLLKNGKISVPVKIKLDSVDQDKLYAALDYLAENQPQTLKKFLSEKQFSDLIAENNPYNRSNLLFKMTGFPGKNFHFVSKYFSVKDRGYITLSKADFLVEDALYFDKNNEGFKQYNFEENPFSVKLENNSFILKLSKSENVVFDLSSLKTLDAGDIEMEKLTFEKENLNWKFRLLIKNGNSTSGRIDHVDWQLFLTRK